MYDKLRIISKEFCSVNYRSLKARGSSLDYRVRGAFPIGVIKIF